MISLVLYGRNDSYGYNLHKRAALSLNCMSEVLSDPDDEVLFVDYNTPDDYPTFPEAIADTLTDKARARIRIFRVRPGIHQDRFGAKTHLKALEGVSRNVAIRRANEANDWVLSTNTDMIFVPRDGHRNMTDVLRDLDGVHYCAPRMEIPETLWESFDRLDPIGVIDETRDWGRTAHLDEIVYGSPNILFDAPGDFQLMRRDAVQAIHGFHEEMLLGWHLDSNMSRRLTIRAGPVGDASDRVFGYHCDHTRQITPMHSHGSVENSIATYVDEVTIPEIPGQRANWGLGDLDIEEIRLEDNVSAAYRRLLRHLIPTPLERPTEAFYRPDSYDETRASSDHILPFLLDLFVNVPAGSALLWVGEDGGLAGRLREGWKAMGFSGKFAIARTVRDIAEHIDTVDFIVVNCGVPDSVDKEGFGELVGFFGAIATAEIDHINAGLPPRRIVAVNAIHNSAESLVKSFVGCARTPFSTRLRHGFLLTELLETHRDLLASLHVGPAGRRQGEEIVSDADEEGHLAYGPYLFMFPGRYRVEFEMELPASDAPDTGKRLFGFAKPKRRAPTVSTGNVEVVLGDEILDHQEISATPSGPRSFAAEFAISDTDSANRLEFRVFSREGQAIRLVGARMTRIGSNRSSERKKTSA